jgi:hypothetical protein
MTMKHLILAILMGLTLSACGASAGFHIGDRAPDTYRDSGAG